MRAARLLDMLLILQRRGRVTAPQLALELEVSSRTVLRDVEALGQAGLPVVTHRGVGGGVELLGGFRTQLTGLTAEEAHGLFLAGQLPIAGLLGLAAAARRVREKLLDALGHSLVDEAERLDGWFLIDPGPAAHEPMLRSELPRLAGAIERRLRVELRWAEGVVVAVEPLGLVMAAATGWWLVARRPDPPGEGQPELMALAGLAGARITRHRFERPEGFRLGPFWDEHQPGGR